MSFNVIAVICQIPSYYVIKQTYKQQQEVKRMIIIMSLLSCFILIGELNKEFVAQDDKEVYFRLWKQLGMASTLTEFSANSNNTIDSIILGAHACSCNSRNVQPIHIYIYMYTDLP